LGPGLVSLVAKGALSPKPKDAKGFDVPKKLSNISCAFSLYS
jgi:hypothetical protein